MLNRTEKNTIILALRQLQRHPVAVKKGGPLLGFEGINNLIEKLSPDSGTVGGIQLSLLPLDSGRRARPGGTDE